VNAGKIIGFPALALLVMFVLFDVTLVLDFGTSNPDKFPDPVVEAEFARCYQEKDRQIHATAFGTIDNPDVQREFISANRAKARRECRALYPESLIAEDNSSGFNIVDLTPRFW